MSAERLQTWAEGCIEQARRTETQRGLQDLVDAWRFLEGKQSMLFGMTCSCADLADPEALGRRVREGLRERYLAGDDETRRDLWRVLTALGLSEGLAPPPSERPASREAVPPPRVAALAGTQPGPYDTLPPSVADLSVSEIWARVEQWLAAHHPELLKLLGPPAAESEIDALERGLGVRLPEEYRASLRIHAGSATRRRKDGTEYADSAFEFVRLLPPSIVLSTWSWLADYATFEAATEPTAFVGAIQRSFYHPGWIPIAARDEDLAVFDCIDTVPTVEAAYGQVVVMCTKDDERAARSRSFGAFLARELLLPLETAPIDEGETADQGRIVLVDEA